MGIGGGSQRRVTRRAIATVAGTAALRVAVRGAVAQQTTPIATGDCSVEPGVQLLLDWRLGKTFIPPSELLAPVDWRIASSTASPLVLQIPSDWEMQEGWAVSISNTGVPNWVTTPPQLPQLALTRIVSSDAMAAFEYAIGSIQGALLMPLQGAIVAKQGLLGENPRLTSICTYEDDNPLAPSWFQADRYKGSVLATSGTALPLPSQIAPASVVSYYTMYGPRASFEELMRTVFIRFFFQMLSAGGNEPTPTPDEGS